VGVKVQLHMFLTSPLDVDQWSASHPGLFTPRGISPKHPSTGCKVGYRGSQEVWRIDISDAPVGN